MVPRDRIELPTRGFSDQIFKIQKFYPYKQLILFQFFKVFLVSFGTILKCLTLTGTIWAQSSFGKNSDIFFLKPPFLVSKTSL